MNGKDEISADTAFAQLFIEMRRYRDLEHRIVVWWTTILLAIMAAFLGFARDDQAYIAQSKGPGIALVLLLGGAMWFLLHYCHLRYRQLRANAGKYCRHPALDLEDPEKKIRPSGYIRTVIPMGIITVGFCVFLGWLPAKGATQMHSSHWIVAGGNMLLAQTIAALFTTGILLATLVFVIRYARAAHRSAEAAREQVEATLAGRAGLFVNDPQTVEQFVERSAAGRRIERKQPNWEHVKDKWLVIEVTNSGDNAMNVRLCAKWKGGHASAEWDKMMSESECESEIDSMVHSSEENTAEGANEVGTWQVWQLPRDESRYVFMPKPSCDREKVLGLIWWAPGYLQWSQCIQLAEKDGKWGGNWAFGKPLRDEKGKGYWPRAECGDLPERV